MQGVEGERKGVAVQDSTRGGHRAVAPPEGRQTLFPPPGASRACRPAARRRPRRGSRRAAAARARAPSGAWGGGREAAAAAAWAICFEGPPACKARVWARGALQGRSPQLTRPWCADLPEPPPSSRNRSPAGRGGCWGRGQRARARPRGGGQPQHGHGRPRRRAAPFHRRSAGCSHCGGARRPARGVSGVLTSAAPRPAAGSR